LELSAKCPWCFRPLLVMVEDVLFKTVVLVEDYSPLI
jgi:hypothetical protein